MYCLTWAGFWIQSVLSKEHSKDWKTKSDASSVNGGDMLEGTLCLENMRLKIKATNEILQSMFLSHDQSQGAIPTIRLRKRSWLVSNTNSLVATEVMILSWEQFQVRIRSWSVFKDMSKIMMRYIWMVTYLRRNVTIVWGASYHLLGSRISLEIWRSGLTSSRILHQRLAILANHNI